jgi:hypothetical protein
MDTLKTYQEIIKQVISDYAKLRPSHGNIHLDPIFDDHHNRYALMQVGWDQERRVRGNLIYVNIENNRFFVTWYGSIGGHKSTKSLSGKRFN